MLLLAASGCAPLERSPAPPIASSPAERRATTTRQPASGEQARTTPPAETLAPRPTDEEGLGLAPLGRAGVLLDRTIAASEAARAHGEAVDAGMLASLRMTRQARDLLAEGETERAADLLERAIAIDDGGGYGYLYLAYIHLSGGRIDQAEVFLARAEALLPNDPALRTELSQLRQQTDSPAAPVAGSR